MMVVVQSFRGARDVQGVGKLISTPVYQRAYDRRHEKRNWQRRIETEKIQAGQRGEEISDEEGRKRAIAKLHRPKLKRLYLPNRYVGAAYDPCFYDGAEVELSQRIGSARTAHLDHNFGTLSPGKKADIIMLAAEGNRFQKLSDLARQPLEYPDREPT
jgi:hypothetical protein